MKRRLIVLLVVSSALSSPALAAEGAAKLLGDESDGSRAQPIHLIPLYSETDKGEKGPQVDPNDPLAMPFSTRFTCGECHSYGEISRGWHFNSVDGNAPAGRPGEPWLYFNSKLGIQLPLSYRAWPGAHRPEQFGLSLSEFTKIFARHMPGGGPGEVTPTDTDALAQQYVTGKLEVNCLACHNAHPGQDQSSPTGYAIQVSKTNFRWASAASCEFADVTGAVGDASPTYDPFMPDESEEKAPRMVYDKKAFDAKGNVFMDIVREAPKERCYFCHSDLFCGEKGEKTEKWCADEDIHMTAGLTCVDCHRNGRDHKIVRGYDGEVADSNNVMAAATSCRGCHLGDENGKRETGGRLGAPVPEHKGIPTVHFERLTCTACHSGPWPSDQPVLAKTSRAHRLGTINVNKEPRVLPHVYAPVFVKEAVADANSVAKIGPHKLVWPAFWGTVDANDGVKPIELDAVTKVVGAVLKDVAVAETGDWSELKEEQIGQVLKALAESGQTKPVYITGGMLFALDDAGAVTSRANHPAAAPYAWAMAHNVRPAAQSLGVGKCTVCHSTKSPFFFGKVAVDSPIVSVSNLTKTQYQFQKASHARTWFFAFSFIFRPWFKVVAIGATAVIGIVLLLYGLKALGSVAKVLAEQEDHQ
ncbi:MAG: hypothetical protein ABFD90_09710 [Phycisphaerales bacterium]